VAAFAAAPGPVASVGDWYNRGRERFEEGDGASMGFWICPPDGLMLEDSAISRHFCAGAERRKRSPTRRRFWHWC